LQQLAHLVDRGCPASGGVDLLAELFIRAAEAFCTASETPTALTEAFTKSAFT
jgi:hypothetical protein